VRLVCAATGSLPALVEDGHFDANLYNQISGLTIRVPSIATTPRTSRHRGDAPHAARRRERSAAEDADRRSLNVMRNLDWPGNLPVLQNVVKTLALTSLSPRSPATT
jgi:transcriptional regulator of acetoin/glycerol metabolism